MKSTVCEPACSHRPALAQCLGLLQHQLHRRLSQVGRVFVLRKIRRTNSRRLARTLSRSDQSTEMFLRRFSVSSWAIFLRVSSVSSRTAGSLFASAS